MEDGARAAFEGHLVRADQLGEGGGIAGLVLATCHDDFVPWLQPDWVFSTQTHELAILTPLPPPKVPLPTSSASSSLTHSL